MILIVHSWSVIPAIADNYYVEKDNNSWPIKITIRNQYFFEKKHIVVVMSDGTYVTILYK